LEYKDASPGLRPSIIQKVQKLEPPSDSAAASRSSYTPYEFDKSKPVIAYNNEKEFLKKFIDDNF
jgi:hypothetical protein